MARGDQPTKRAFNGLAVVLMLVLMAALAPARGDAPAAESLDILSWGGAYARAQRRALFAPFTQATGIPVRVHSYNGGLSGLRKAVSRGQVPWDLIDMRRSRAQTALAQLIPYGPSRRSATRQITTHPDSGVDMRLHIPTHPLNAKHAITKDVNWYARTHTRISEYFREALFGDPSGDNSNP